MISASTIKGDDVVNTTGEDVGKIEELMIDSEKGEIGYAVLSLGGTLGMGGKFFAIPWDAFTLDADNHRFVLDVPRERLDQAPGFDKDHWPETTGGVWWQDIGNYWEAHRRSEASNDQPAVASSEVRTN